MYSFYIPRAIKVHPTVQKMSCKRNSFLTHELILIKLYTVVVFNLRMCIKKNNPGWKYFKGDDY